jgi:predicted amidohydrolase YtcJ
LARGHTFAGSKRSNAGAAQRITREEAVAMWTRDAARVLRWSDIGTLAVGNHADLIVVDPDPMVCEVEAIGETRVHATLLGGALVHGDEAAIA